MKDGQDNDGDDHHAEMAQASSEAVWPAAPKWYPLPGHPGKTPPHAPRWANTYGPTQALFPWPRFAPEPVNVDPCCEYPWPDGGVDLHGPTSPKDLKNIPIPRFTNWRKRFEPPLKHVPIMWKLV